MTTEASSESRWPMYIRLAGTLAALGLLLYWLTKQGWSEFSAALTQVPTEIFAVAILIVLLSRMGVVARWFILLRSGEIEMGLRMAAMLTFAGLFASNFLPTTIGGDIFRIAGVGQVPRRRTAYITSIFADRIVGLLGMATALPWAALPALNYLQGRVGLDFRLVGVPLAAGFTNKPSRSARIRSRLGEVLSSVIEALRMWSHRPLGLLSAFVATWFYMVCRFGSIWVLLHAMGEHISFGTIAGLWSMTYFITLIPISIGGLGLQEVSMTFIFTTLGGVSPANALPTAVLVRAMDALVSVPGAFFLPQAVSWRRSRMESDLSETPPNRQTDDSLAESEV